MHFVSIESPHYFTPEGNTELVDINEELFVDSNNNVFKPVGDKFLKVGYYANGNVSSKPFVIPSIGLGVVMYYLFSRRRVNNADFASSIVFTAIAVVIAAFFAYAVVVGWLVNVCLIPFSNKVTNLNKYVKLLTPNFWHSGKAYISGYLMLATPVLLVLGIISLLIDNANNGPAGFSQLFAQMNLCSLLFSAIAIIYNICLNIKHAK